MVTLKLKSTIEITSYCFNEPSLLSNCGFKEPPKCEIINVTQMFTKKMKTRLFLLHSNEIGQPISSFREFSEECQLHSKSMCFMCVCPQKKEMLLSKINGEYYVFP